MMLEFARIPLFSIFQNSPGVIFNLKFALFTSPIMNKIYYRRSLS
nr:MAG TPA: hypothetical protein [Caudoviricetes sp.]